jgi:hypothetical protein
VFRFFFTRRNAFARLLRNRAAAVAFLGLIVVTFQGYKLYRESVSVNRELNLTASKHAPRARVCGCCAEPLSVHFTSAAFNGNWSQSDQPFLSLSLSLSLSQNVYTPPYFKTFIVIIKCSCVIYGAHSAADLITLLSTQKRNLYSSRVPSETQYLDLEPGVCALFPYPAGARSGISPNCAVEWIWEFGVYTKFLNSIYI